MNRRQAILGISAVALSSLRSALADGPDPGIKLAKAARAQVGVTTGYDPRWIHLAYPGGDPPRSTGVCADVIIRAGRDALGLDLQKLVHEDMQAAFDQYPARKVWGSREPDTNIDHRRVLNLGAYWRRTGCCLWTAKQPTAGDAFPIPFAVGDIVTWMLDARLPHVGIIVQTGSSPAVVHNIGNGAEETYLSAFHNHRAAGHFRWPKRG